MGTEQRVHPEDLRALSMCTLLPGEVTLDRIQPALYHFADYVRGHEVHSACSRREALPDTLQARV